MGGGAEGREAVVQGGGGAVADVIGDIHKLHRGGALVAANGL
jgi:hypothetical protein